MTAQSKVRKVGNSLGIVLPKEVLQALRVEEGATVYLTEGPGGTLQVSPDRPDFAESLRLAEEGMQRYRNTLRELAK
jgi:putative addiction module antidote